MINKILGCILILSSFQCGRIVEKKGKLTSKSMRIQYPIRDGVCEHLSQEGYFFSSSALFVNEKLDTIKVSLIDSVVFKRKKYYKLSLLGTTGLKQLESHYFNLNVNNYSELLIEGKDTLDYNTIDLRVRNEFKAIINTQEIGGYSVFTDSLICNDRRIVKISRVLTSNLVFPFEKNGGEIMYLNRLLWSEEKGLLAFALLKEGSYDYYFYRNKL